MRWRGWVWVVGLWAGVGCVSNPQPDIPQDAVISYQTVRATYPGEDTDAELPVIEEESSVGALGLRGSPLVGDASPTRGALIDTMKSVNALMFHVIRLLEVVSARAPVERAEEALTWQVVGRRRETRLTVERQEDLGAGERRFGYSMGVRPVLGAGDEGFVGVLDGYFDRAKRQPEVGRRAGQGLLRLKLDALRALDGGAPAGELVVAFRRRGGVLQVLSHLRRVQRRVGEGEVSGAVRYVVLPDGSGDADFMSQGDILKDGEPLEVIGVRASWDAQGAGRAVIRVTGGSLAPGATLRLDECWGEDGRTVWLRSEPSIVEWSGGAQGACAESLRGLILVPPEEASLLIGEDPLIPAPDPREVGDL
jgi:hypothetical protein